MNSTYVILIVAKNATKSKGHAHLVSRRKLCHTEKKAIKRTHVSLCMTRVTKFTPLPNHSPTPSKVKWSTPNSRKCPFKLAHKHLYFQIVIKVSTLSKSGILTNKMNIYFFCLNVFIYLTMRDCAKAVKPERALCKLTPKGRGATCNFLF